jgi:hypothetical protein
VVKFDGDKMQLMVQGEDVRVRSVDTAKEGNIRTLTIVALINPTIETTIAKAWNDAHDTDDWGNPKGVFNAGKVKDQRLDLVNAENRKLQREIRALRKKLAQRTLSEVADLPELD